MSATESVCLFLHIIIVQHHMIIGLMDCAPMISFALYSSFRVVCVVPEIDTAVGRSTGEKESFLIRLLIPETTQLAMHKTHTAREVGDIALSRGARVGNTVGNGEKRKLLVFQRQINVRL